MLHSVQIKNYRSCVDTTVRFNSPVCALIGKNGTGKTTTLKAIEAICRAGLHDQDLQELSNASTWEGGGLVRAALDETLFEYALTYTPVSAPEDEGDWHGEVLDESLVINPLTDKEECVFDRSGEEIWLPGRATPVLTGARTPAISALTSLLPESDPVKAAIEPLRQFLASVKYYSLEVSVEKMPILEADYIRWRSALMRGDEATDSVLFRILYMIKEDPEMFRELTSLLGATGIGLVEVQQVPFAFIKDDKSGTTLHFISFSPLGSLGGAGSSFEFNQLSAGTRRIIRMFVYLLFDKRSVMLIEEPEDSIHPGLLRKLVSIFRSYGHKTQVVFATHSADVLDMLSPEDVLLVDAPNGETRVRQLSPDEVRFAREFLNESGTLSEFLTTVDQGD